MLILLATARYKFRRWENQTFKVCRQNAWWTRKCGSSGRDPTNKAYIIDVNGKKERISISLKRMDYGNEPNKT